MVTTEKLTGHRSRQLVIDIRIRLTHMVYVKSYFWILLIENWPSPALPLITIPPDPPGSQKNFGEVFWHLYQLKFEEISPKLQKMKILRKLSPLWPPIYLPPWFPITPSNSEIICGQNVSTKVVCGIIFFFEKKAMLKIWKKSWVPFKGQIIL